MGVTFTQLTFTLQCPIQRNTAMQVGSKRGRLGELH